MSIQGSRPNESATSSTTTRDCSLDGGADIQVEVLFLTGPPGAGKTAIAKELSELLWQLREPHAVIEIDELCRGILPTSTTNFNHNLAVANLRAVWATFQQAGVRRLIVARMVETLDDLERFASVIPHAHVTVCLVQTPEHILQQRITGREPGSARLFLLTTSRRVAAQLADLKLPGIAVDNGQRSISEVAREILERVQWPYPPASSVGLSEV